MARITNTELLTKYRNKLEQSRRWRREERYDDLWSRLIDLYRGKHHRTDIKEDQLLVNIAFATINVISPAVSINHPKIAVNAKRPEDANKAIYIIVNVLSSQESGRHPDTKITSHHRTKCISCPLMEVVLSMCNLLDGRYNLIEEAFKELSRMCSHVYLILKYRRPSPDALMLS